MSDWPSASAPAEAWTHLDTQVLSVAATAITFSGIAAVVAPRLRLYAYVVRAGAAGNTFLRFNNDSTAVYQQQRIAANGVTVNSARNTAATNIQHPQSQNIAANEPMLTVITIKKPVAGEVGRTVSTIAVEAAAGIVYEASAGEWTNTAALINRVDLLANTGSNLDAGTRLVLEGAAA